MRIKKKLILLFILISLLPLTFTILTTFVIAKKSLTSQVLKQLDSVATIQKHRLIGIMENNLERLSLIASRTQLRLSLNNFLSDPNESYQKKMNKILSDAQASIHDFEDIAVLTMKGKVVASTNNSLIGMDFSKEVFFQKGLDKKNVDIFFLDEYGNLRMYLSGPLYLEEKLIGVLAVKSTAHNIITLVTDYTGLGETGETIIAKQDEKGNALFLTPIRFDSEAALKRTVNKDNTGNPIIQALNKKEVLCRNAFNYHGEPVLASTRYIEEADTGLAVIVHQDEAFVTIKRLRNLFWALLLFSSIFIILILLKISKIVTKPIDRLSEVAQMISEGDLSQKADIVSNDEIGNLAKSFNKMTKNLIKEIIDRRDAEDELSYSEERFRNLTESTSDWIWEVDIDTTYNYSSPKVRDLLGYELEEIIGKTPFDFMPLDEAKRVKEEFRDIQASQIPFKGLENINIHKDGRPVVIETSGVPVFNDKGLLEGYRGIDRDISDRKQMETELNESLERLKIILNSLDAIVYVTDMDTYEILFVNKYVRNIFGDVTGKICWKAIQEGQTGPCDFCTKDKVIDKNSMPVSVYKREFQNPINGRWYLASDQAIRWIGGKTVRMEIATDITERKKMEMELRDLNINLEKRITEEVEKNRQKDQLVFEQSRQIAMGELLINIAHHWRQPLNTVGVIAQEIEDAYKFQELDREHLTRSVSSIMVELKKLSDTINTFKDIYYPKEEKIKMTLADSVRKSLSLMDSNAKSNNVTFDVEIREDVFSTISPGGFSQSIINILRNSIDILKEKRKESRQIKISLTRAPFSGKALITIADNGGGISEDIIDKIFDPYFTTDFKKPGKGLGLYLAKTIIETEMGGTLNVKNKEHGAEFTIEL